jgi:natural product precursor
MKNLKKIKLANINDSELEKSQLNKITGGDNPCYDCTGCAGVTSHMSKNSKKYNANSSAHLEIM